MSETWRPVFGADGCYEVSDLGRVRSVSRMLPRRVGRPMYLRGRILSQSFAKRVPYPCVGLSWPDGRKEKVRVHRLVLEAFVGPRPPGMVCRHLDGNPKNNHLSNLAWGTPKENSDDSQAHGTQVHGSRVGAAKLTEEQVAEMRRMYATGSYTQKQLAARFGVHEETVFRALARKHWSHVDVPRPRPIRVSARAVQAAKLIADHPDGLALHDLAQMMGVSNDAACAACQRAQRLGLIRHNGEHNVSARWLAARGQA